MSAGAAGGASQVKSAVRTVELLEFFSGRPGLHSLAAVQEATGYPKSSLYMLLRTLVDLGWVETDATDTRYGIGVRALLVGTSYLDGDEVVYVARVPTRRIMRIAIAVGTRFPAYATSMGRVLLAGQTDEWLDGYFATAPLTRITSRTIADAKRLRGELNRIRRDGYGWSVGEGVASAIGLAVPVFGSDGGVIGSLSVTYPEFRMDDALNRKLILLLRDGAERLSRALGWRDDGEASPFSRIAAGKATPMVRPTAARKAPSG